MELSDDSIPRGVPKPTSFEETLNKPEVPEVSLIFDSKSPFDKNSETNPKLIEQPTRKASDLAPASEPYNVWRFKNAHILNHVSSRSNSFQPAPIYNGMPENKPSYCSNSSVDPSRNLNDLHNGHQMNHVNGISDKRQICRTSPSKSPSQSLNHFQNDFQINYMNGTSENGPTPSFNPSENSTRNPIGFQNNHQMNYETGISGRRPTSSSSPSENPLPIPNSFQNGFHVNYMNGNPQNKPMFGSIPSENLSRNPNSLPNGYQMNCIPSEAQIERLKHNSIPPENSSRNPNCLQNGYQMNCIPSETQIERLKHNSIPTENSSRNPNCLQNGYQMTCIPNEAQIERLKHNSIPSGSPSRNPNTLQNGYQMNYVHFSSVATPMSNPNSTVAQTNGFRNQQDVSTPPQNNQNLNHCGGFNPHEPKDLVVKNSDRRVAFNDPPRNTFHSVSPCNCNSCTQKMHTKICQLPQQERQVNSLPVSPSNASERLKSKKISTSDLYQIVVNQTEQLMLLRQKVDELLKEKTSPQIDASCIQKSPTKRSIAIQVNADEDLQQKSVGVMTSFSDRGTTSPQLQKPPPQIQNAEKNCSCSCSHQSSARSSPRERLSDKDDTGSNQSKKTTPNSSPFSQDKTEVSLTLNAANLPPVPEQILSPEPSVHVEMQDYHSSSDDESFESVKQNPDNLNQNARQNGWTFYDNVIGQVNNILQNSQEAALRSQSAPKSPVNSVRQATLEQLQKMGITGVDENNKNSCDRRMGQELLPPQFNQLANQYNCRESDLSLHMNDLAMKYLNKNQLTNAVGIQRDIAVCNMNGETNLSFTTLRYLERYHLMPAELKQGIQGKQEFSPGMECCPQDDKFNRPQPHFENNHLHQAPQRCENKILDITALRQQPYLL